MVQTCDLARLRSNTYLILADLYLPPTVDTMSDAFILANRVSEDAFTMAHMAFYPTLNALVSRILALTETPMDAIARLYHGANENGQSNAGPVPLLEAEYVGASTPKESALLKSDLEYGYRNVGLDLSSTLPIEPDHAGAECLYLGLLARLEADAWESQDFDTIDRVLQIEVAFLRDHPCQWFPDLASLHTMRMPGSYLSDVSRAAHGMVVHDLSMLSAIYEKIETIATNS
ncbi:MAG: molecular chaperone TorD family protein [SAR202 cluster bacterium]|jgi:hypothetical protein|nr:molecular chaperone TorD family protein [SAR202 cluster bacterium]MDP6514097.1 molecular chaperone TorD family protein [SAR202 cluster bacterium]MDP6716512.1 molecular chaperone TorD family protein [SAR202 cluster bacterium]